MKKIKEKFKFSKREVRFDQEGRVELGQLGVFPTFRFPFHLRKLKYMCYMSLYFVIMCCYVLCMFGSCYPWLND